MAGENPDDLLRQLTTAVVPPQQPLGVGSQPLPANLPPLPADLLPFIRKYGSGYFDIDGDVFLEVLNPFEDAYEAKQNRDLENLRRLKATEGDEYIPYGISPETPGLLPWGFGEDRKHFFWLTEGDPQTWPVIVMYDLEIFTRFEGPMLKFLKELMCGEIDCSFIGGVVTPDGRVDPAMCEFVAEISPA